MNLNWILISIDATLLGAMAVIWILVSAIRRDRGRLLAEVADLRSALEALQSKAKASQPATFAPTAALNTDRRAEALEMLRYGMDASTVSAKLRLSQAEATLLGKVQSLLTPAAHRQ